MKQKKKTKNSPPRHFAVELRTSDVMTAWRQAGAKHVMFDKSFQLEQSRKSARLNADGAVLCMHFG